MVTPKTASLKGIFTTQTSSQFLKEGIKIAFVELKKASETDDHSTYLFSNSNLKLLFFN